MFEPRGCAAAEYGTQRLARQVLHDDEPERRDRDRCRRNGRQSGWTTACVRRNSCAAGVRCWSPGTQLRAQQLDRDAASVRSGCVAAQVHGPPDRCIAAIADLGLEYIAVAQHVFGCSTVAAGRVALPGTVTGSAAGSAAATAAPVRFARDFVREVLGRVGTARTRARRASAAGWKLSQRVLDVRAHARNDPLWPHPQYAPRPSLLKRSQRNARPAASARICISRIMVRAYQFVGVSSSLPPEGGARRAGEFDRSIANDDPKPIDAPTQASQRSAGSGPSAQKRLRPELEEQPVTPGLSGGA